MISLYRPKILLLDDKSSEISTMAYFLSAGGMDVILAVSEKEGQDQLGVSNVDAIVAKAGDVESDLFSFTEKQVDRYPIILFGGPKESKLSKKWKEISDAYIQDQKAEKQLAELVFKVIKSKNSVGKAAA